MVFVDTWAWLALALRRDQHHQSATGQHQKFVADGRRYVTTDYVISELVTQLFRSLPSHQAMPFVDALLGATDAGEFQLEYVTPSRFRDAWIMRKRYADKPTISFVDFTSFVVMKEMGITDVFTGDHHFEQVNMGFRRLP